jgi:hypothetical protein
LVSVKALEFLIVKMIEFVSNLQKNFVLKIFGVVNMNEFFPNFTGKSVVFYVKTSSTTPDWMTEGLVLESPVFQTQGNRLFIVGQTPKDESPEESWSASREAGVAWDSVFYYVTLPSGQYYEYRENEPDDD